MENLPCPKCQSNYSYQVGNLWTCPECSHEWTEFQNDSGKPESSGGSNDTVIHDSVGNVLTDGDAVTVIKDLKIKGSSTVVKVGTKVKSIRLVDSNDGHNIACKVEGIGPINLKSEFVKKS